MEYCKISPKISKSAPQQGFCVYDLWGNAKKIPEKFPKMYSVVQKKGMDMQTKVRILK